jgi:N-acetylmuramoyl-L-alanine amidase
MNRLAARLSSLVVACVLCGGIIAPARTGAQTVISTNFWFAGTKLVFEHPTPLDGDIAVSIRDTGLQKLLSGVGATLSYQPQQRYIIVTAADHRVITFVVGDAHYTVAGVSAKATFAPFLDGNEVIVPLLALARSLYLEPVQSDRETVLEPQLGALDVHVDGRRTIVTLRGATTLRYTKISETPERLQLTFNGVATTLVPARRVGGGIDQIDIVNGGVARNPSTTVTISAVAGEQHLIAASGSPYEFTVVFGPPGVALDLHPAVPVNLGTPPPVAYVPPPTPVPQTMTNAPAMPAQTPAPSAYASPMQTGPAIVTDVNLVPSDDGLAVRLSLSAPATFDWHRLNDDRWYVDIHNATLTGAGRDERPNLTAVDSIRVRQIGTPDAPAVRVAITLRGDRRVELVPGENALTVAVSNTPEVNLAHTGSGQTVGTTVAQNDQATSSATPDPYMSPPDPSAWKFGPQVNGSRIIVIDPGHGGGDAGTAHNGLVEKNLTLNISMRLRALLTQQGWNVRMTRDSDIDPVSQANLTAFAADGKPNANDRAYLQTRCDVANSVNARLFISIHVNYAPSAAVNGTTFYYTKPQDVALAQALERNVIPLLGTKDDGVIKNDFYVTKHTTMPAVLIETGFISNAHDAALLADPNALQNIALGIAAGVRAYAGALPALSSKADPE